MALKFDRSLWSLGTNSDGQLGAGATASTGIFLRIGTDNNWGLIEAGDNHTLGIRNDGSLWAWGFNSTGQLGDGTRMTRRVPTRIGTDNNWSRVAAGTGHSIALKSDGSIWMWGDNMNGQLGDGTGVITTLTRVGTNSDWGSPSAVAAPAAIETDPLTQTPPVDSDGDGFTDAEESLAGTNPLDPASALRLSARRTGGTDVALEFSTVPGRTYAVECCTNLVRGVWITLRANISGDGEPFHFLDAAPATRGPQCFYRVRVGR